MRRSPALVAALALMAFLAVLAFRPRSGSGSGATEARLPQRYKLADLIEQQQKAAAHLRQEVSELRADVDAERTASATRSDGSAQRAAAVAETSEVAGLVAVNGPGLKVTLNDSRLEEPPTGG